ncbi:MAG TPA: glycine zipper 2TM domain-containing protein [Burkholderiales bacterium]
MRKSILMGAVIGTAAVLSAGAMAGYLTWKNPAYAEVVSVDPVRQAVTTPERVCRDEQVTRRKPVNDEHRIIGTVIGGMAGGVVGHQIGNGTGKTVATVAGAAAGGYAGNQVQKKMQEKDIYVATEKHCKTANRVSEKVVAYDVRYRLHGKTSKVRMDHDPGPRLPVKDGKVVLTHDPDAKPDSKA